MTRTSMGLLSALLLVAPAAAWGASPLTGALELKLGGYRPQIDSEPGLLGKPFATTFGDHNILLFEAEVEHQFFQRFGSLAGGLSAGYGEIYGHGVFASGPQAGVSSADTTALKVYPLKALGIYRFDVPARHYGIPLVPFAKAGLIYQIYRITNGAGQVAVDSQGNKGQGGRWGYEYDLGLALMLDWLDEPLARDFDVDIGINHSYFFAEWRHEIVDGFGKAGIDFSDNKLWMFGLALEY